MNSHCFHIQDQADGINLRVASIYNAVRKEYRYGALDILRQAALAEYCFGNDQGAKVSVLNEHHAPFRGSERSSAEHHGKIEYRQERAVVLGHADHDLGDVGDLTIRPEGND